MRWDLKIKPLLTLLFLLWSATVGMSISQGRIVGVQEGDYFRYADFEVNWTSTDPNATFPPHGKEWIVERNKTKWMSLSVQNIAHTFISFQCVKHFEDETEKINEGLVDVDTGLGEMGFFAISANLDANDSVYTGNPYSAWKVNRTIIRAYPDSSRETNHLNMTWELSGTTNETSTNGTIWLLKNNYWDRTSGILVERSYEEIEQTGEYTTTVETSYRLIESNLWVVPEFSVYTLIVTLIVTTIGIFLLMLTFFSENKLEKTVTSA